MLISRGGAVEDQGMLHNKNNDLIIINYYNESNNN